MPDVMTGQLRKMKAQLGETISYQIPVGEVLFPINEKLGEEVNIKFTGNIFCTACGRKTNKSFSQGYCFPCFKSLAECDMCIVRPETCHYHEGTCRDPQWADNHCMQEHFVYLANSSGLKVGITRQNQIPTRWIDQGATQAIKMYRVKNRYHSGLVESTLKKWISDRTDWRKMLKGQADPLNMAAARDELLAQADSDLKQLSLNNPEIDLTSLTDQEVELNYPVQIYPEKVTSLNLDKSPEVSGKLNGIKGQYLIFDTGVINIRKFTGYEISLY